MFEAFYLLGTVTLVLNGIRPFGLNIALSDLLYFAALVSLIMDGLSKRQPVQKWMPWHPFLFSSGLILIGGLLATTQSQNPVVSIASTLKSWFLFSVWISMGIIMVYQRRRAGRVIGALLVGVMISSVAAIIDSQTGTNLGPRVFELSGTQIYGIDLATLANVYGRYGGTLGHPNIQGEFTLVAIPIVLDLSLSALGAAKRQKSIGLLVLLTVLVWANLLTGSVSAMLGMLLSFTLVIGLRLIRKLAWRVVPFSLIATGIGLIIVLAVSSSELDPLQTLVRGGSENKNVYRALNDTGPQRIALIGDTLSLIFENPVVGYGMDLLTADNPSETGAAAGAIHNALLRSWLVGGLFVFMGVAYAYFRSLHLAVQTIVRYGQGHDVKYMFGLAVSIIVWIATDMVQPSFYQRFTWLTVGLLYGLSANHLRSAVEHAGLVRGTASLSDMDRTKTAYL